MNIVYIVVFSLTSALLLLVAMAIPVLVVRNIRHGHLLQKKLEHEVSGLRLGRMLEHRAIDIKRYLRRERAGTILGHAGSCRACESRDACDESLQKPASAEHDTSFCPNNKSLHDIANKYSK